MPNETGIYTAGHCATVGQLKALAQRVTGLIVTGTGIGTLVGIGTDSELSELIAELFG